MNYVLDSGLASLIVEGRNARPELVSYAADGPDINFLIISLSHQDLWSDVVKGPHEFPTAKVTTAAEISNLQCKVLNKGIDT